jgi:hypothetical protein
MGRGSQPGSGCRWIGLRHAPDGSWRAWLGVEGPTWLVADSLRLIPGRLGLERDLGAVLTRQRLEPGGCCG